MGVVPTRFFSLTHPGKNLVNLSDDKAFVAASAASEWHAEKAFSTNRVM